jgi:hypothetical protein
MESRGYNLPYCNTNPRTVNGARKRGWHTVKITDFMSKHGVSWFGLVLWADRNCLDHYVHAHMRNTFAFKSEQDASWFILRWL